MPIADLSKRLSRDRVNFRDSLTKRDVRTLLADMELKVLQCSSPVDLYTWELLNNDFFIFRPEIQLRVWGFHSSVCDLAFTSRMTNVHHFSADCLMDAIGVDHIAAMENLESLGIGIFHLEGFGFLNQITLRLKKLFLGRTKSSKPSLSPLSQFDSLQEIYLEAQQKNIEVLFGLDNLLDVTLRSISTPDINFLRPLHRMWSLDIKLGGIKDLSAIEELENIKYLELWQIRGLSNIEFISTLTGLQYLFLQSLRQVTALPSFNRLKKLRRIYLENMRSLEDVNSLEFAPALEEFVHRDARNLQPEDYIPLLRNPHLRRVAVGFGSDKRNVRFKERLREYNIEPLHRARKFDFV